MATTIANFLVGLGLDSTEFNKGQRDVTSGLDSLRSKALQLGALAGGAFGVKALTLGFAEAKDNIGKFSEVFAVLPDDIQAMGNALAQEGGSLESFMGQIESLQRLRASTPQQIGALFAESGIRGIDPSVILNAKSATEAYKNLADVFERLDPKQRLAAANVFGLDEASIRLLSNGRDELEAMIERQRQIRPLTEEMTESAAEFKRQWKDLKNNVGALADEISLTLVPIMTGLVASGNEFSQLIREGVSIGQIISETGQGGRLSAEAAYGRDAAYLDEPVGDVTARGGELSSGSIFGDNALTQFLDTPLRDLFMDNGGPQPTFNDPATRDMALEMLNRMKNERASQIPLSDDLFMNNERAIQVEASQPYTYGVQSQPSTHQPYVTPQPQRNNNNRPIEVNLKLDGHVLDKRIIDVSSQMDSDALDDITSSTGG